MSRAAEDPTKQLEQSLPRYRFGMGFLFCMFTLPVLVPYYASKGLSTAEFFFIEGIYRFAYFLFNFLSGYISDRWSRKGCLLIGAALWASGTAIIISTHGFWGVALGEITLALGMSFFTSPGRAYLYDALLSLGRGGEHPRALSRQRATEHAMRSAAMAVGGFLFVWWAEAPQVAVLITTTISLLLFSGLREPPQHEAQVGQFSIANYKKTFRTIFFECPGLPALIFFSALLIGSTVLVFWGMQPVMRDIGVAPQHFGLFMAGAGLVTSFFSSISHRIIDVVGITRLAYLLFAAMMLSLLTLIFVHHPLAMLAFILNSFIFVTATNAFDDLIQRQVPSAIRATTLSAATLCEMGFSAPLLLMTGFLMGTHSLGTSLIYMCALIFVLGLILLALFLKDYPKLKQAYEQKSE